MPRNIAPFASPSPPLCPTIFVFSLTSATFGIFVFSSGVAMAPWFGSSIGIPWPLAQASKVSRKPIVRRANFPLPKELQLSLWALPFRVYDSAADPGILPMRQSRKLVGWEDRAHLAELTGEDKAVIHEWQKTVGVSLSKFE